MTPTEHTLKDGRALTLREAEPEDALAVLDYTHTVSAESDNLTFGAGEFELTVPDEEAYLKACKLSQNRIYILAHVEGELVGTLSFAGGHRPRTRHRGEFGMTVRKDFWGLGIGSLLLGALIDWARATGIITKINLGVRTNNARAINLYRRKGFVHEGTVSRGMIIDGEYIDYHNMGLELD